MQIRVNKKNKLKGEITIPADKSISHRAVMFASLAKGISVIKNFSKGADCLSTLEVIKALGVDAQFKDEKTLIINSKGVFTAPRNDLYCGNSGTTMRLMAGILAGQSFNSVLTGDESLSKRPMGRIIEPLEMMGAKIEAKSKKQKKRRQEDKKTRCVEGQDENYASTLLRIHASDNLSTFQPFSLSAPSHLSPLTSHLVAPLKIHGTTLHGIDYISELSSAQVKSCVLLAGLHAEGKTSFTEPYLSRNHTERMLEYLGARITRGEEAKRHRCIETNDVTFHASTPPRLLSSAFTTIEPSTLQARKLSIPGDISSAAFFIVAGLIVPNSEIILKNVGLNPTRTGILDIVEKMGGDIEILDKKIVSNEEVGDLRVKSSDLKSCTIEGDIIPRLIDELPVIAVLATQAQGTTVIKEAQDLRNKESDRIKAVVEELKKIGADIEETEDGFVINGKKTLKGGVKVETYHDHRLAMSLYVAGLICENPILINGFEWVNISFPEFEDLMNRI
ncbi:MAG: 3-phosphoshikimate 1-carboxyvinyltransferase [Candidatus Gastranaerophilales bacterium]|nr:3-phosphoshikimate 1-carboxyvinyltransferase [Candidatus Gastranaerophilales bacterium]